MTEHRDDIEIENKLVVSAEDMETAFAALAKEAGDGAVARRHLARRYFDTDDLALYKSMTVWRVEETGAGAYLQTVKHASAEDIAKSEETGIHARNEWEFETGKPEPDTDAFAGSDAERVLRPVAGRDLHHIFTTEIDRRAITVDVATEDGRSGRVEIAFDLGAAVLLDGKTRAPIREIEVELKSGDAAAVTAVVERIRAVAPSAEPSVVTKSDTGFGLYKSHTRADAPGRDNRRAP